MQIDLITRTDFELLVNKIDMLLAATIPVKKDTIEILEVKEAAKKLRVSEKTLRSYIECGKLPAINMNKDTAQRPVYKIDASDIAKFIKDRRTSLR